MRKSERDRKERPTQEIEPHPSTQARGTPEIEPQPSAQPRRGKVSETARRN